MIDSSTIPSDINVSPTFTICMLAERCMRLCAADFSWRMSYDVSQNVAKQLGDVTFSLLFHIKYVLLIGKDIYGISMLL